MKVIKTNKALRGKLAFLRSQGKSIGFVPTMGAFHEGHVSLMRRCVKENDITVVSLFVNPLQFGPREDLARYPRNLKRDIEMASAVNVDFLFVPSLQEIYPEPLSTFVQVGKIGNILCGASRPGHFQGVATVVLKLLNIVQPCVIYLGQKDAQQVAVIKRMIFDLNIPVSVVICPTSREADGLAMSSRNIYLSPTERRDAVVLNKALRMGARLIAFGERDGGKIISKIKKLILEGSSASIDYVSIVEISGFAPVRRISKDVLIVIAVKFGTTRLIDNVIVKVHGK
ncbi:MAG: pantoate--beta-alanine ligase [Candidatus Omnitrophica bacterium]|nr:pantoate--beta-alanine ligase [Candidatus Omnitrophota bacterium]